MTYILDHISLIYDLDRNEVTWEERDPLAIVRHTTQFPIDDVPPCAQQKMRQLSLSDSVDVRHILRRDHAAFVVTPYRDVMRIEDLVFDTHADREPLFALRDIWDEYLGLGGPIFYVWGEGTGSYRSPIPLKTLCKLQIIEQSARL